MALLGIILAVLLVGAVTFPYAITWVNLGYESKEFHVAYEDGETYVRARGGSSHKSNVFVNVTVVSIHPQAAVEAYSEMFSSELVFFVMLHPNVTEFICDEIRMYFRSLTGTYDYYGLVGLSFTTGRLVDFYREWRDEGNIAPFSTKVTLPINPSHWPPFRQTLTFMLSFADRIETTPLLTLSGRFKTINNTEINNYGFLIHFNMTSYNTSIYRFNYPPTLWLAYGASMLIFTVSTIYLIKRRPSQQNWS